MCGFKALNQYAKERRAPFEKEHHLPVNLSKRANKAESMFNFKMVKG